MDKKKSRRVIVNLIWSIRELCNYNVAYMVLMIFESIIKGISPVVTLIITEKMVNSIQLKSGTLKEIIILLSALTLYGIISELVLNYAQLKIHSYEMLFDTFIQTKILEKISILDCKNFENSSTYDLINRTQYDANIGVLGNIRTIFSIVSFLISALSFVVIIIKYSIVIFIIVAGVPIIRYFFEKKYNIFEYNTIKKNTEYNRKSTYISYLLTNAEYFKEIKMFSLFDFFIRKYRNLKSIYNTDLIGVYTRRTVSYSLLSVIEIAINFFIVLNIIVQTFSGNLLIGQFILYNNSIDNLKQNLMSIFSELSLMYKNSLIIDQIREFFELPKEDLHENGIIINEILTIRMENVSYRYKDNYVLKNINIKLVKGDFVVIMGYNGSGKSTLMKVIMGIYHDYEGSIYVNDINLKKLNIDNYREKVGVLFQDYIKYETCLSENIWYGNLKYRNDIDIVDELLKKVSLNELKEIKNQPLGYQFRDGIQISMGQWQKLSLARTIIKDAELYIFDEPNASLDLVSEDFVLNTIYTETKKIRIIIMHRFNHIIMKSSKIIVLNNGGIEEMGTHNELLENKKLYFELYSMQNGFDDL